MINGLEGIPGSGKSYEAVVMHVLPALKKGRKVITNLPLLVSVFEALDPAFVGLIELRTKPQPVLGVWDAEAVDDRGNGDAFRLFGPGEKPQDVVVPFPFISGAGPNDVRLRAPVTRSHASVFGSVWDYYSDWKHPVSGLGPLFIIDECHLAMPDKGTDAQVVEWFKLHRHFNADVLLATQSFRDMCQPIARLFEILIRCRKATVLGKSGSYIRKVYAGYRGAVISTEERKYEKQYFALYRSHTQGNSVSEAGVSDVEPFIVKFRRFTWAFWVFAIGFCLYAFWPTSNKAGMLGFGSKPVGSSVVSVASAQAVVPVAASSAPAAVASSPVVVDLEPFKDKLIHISGWMRGAQGVVYTFVVSMGGTRQFDLLLADLVRAGYKFEPLGECVGYLHWREKSRVVMCDAPVLATGSQNAPVVMDAGSGVRSDDRKASSVQPQLISLRNTDSLPERERSIVSSSSGDVDALESMHSRVIR